jgi:hypothetical protein
MGLRLQFIVAAMAPCQGSKGIRSSSLLHLVLRVAVLVSLKLRWLQWACFMKEGPWY